MILVLFLTCFPAFPQGSTGRIAGTVTDQTGGAMAGATVTVTDVSRGVSRTLTTDASGAYNAPNLTPGMYSVRSEAKGFKAVERQNIVLEVSQDVRVDLQMQPGEEAQTVTVTETLPLVDTSSAELGGTITNQVINDLPLNGRNFENLLDLRPGVQKYPGNSGWTQSTNGMRPHDNMFLVEGTDSNDPWMAQSMMNAVMAAGDAGTVLPIDAIDEFKTQQNPRAEYGWKPGAVVNVGIKSGTNTLHGTAYAYGRDGDWDAREYFNTVPNPKPPVQVEQFGASVGAPIKKDKLFYFANYEGQRYDVGNPVQHSVPITGGANATSDAANGLIGACLAVPSASRSALSLQLAGLGTNCNALPNYPGLFPVNNNTSTIINTGLITSNSVNGGVAKLDYHINEKNSLTGMYFFSQGDGVFVDNPTVEIAQQWLTDQHARAQVGSGNWTWTPNSAWVNQARFGYSHYYQAFFGNDHTQNPANYTYNGATYNVYTGQTDPTKFGLPLIEWQPGTYDMQMGLQWPKIAGPDAVWDIGDNISYLRGNHSFKFGGEVLVLQSTNNIAQTSKGTVRFNGLQNFISGNMNRARFLAGNVLRHNQSESYGVFAQDDWRIRPRLTLNLGIRYELNTVVTEANNLEGNFDPTKGLVQEGSGVSPYNGDHNNFAPRLGLAWDIQGNGKTVVRAAIGMYYEQASFDSLMGIGNTLGLRTVPTGAAICVNNCTTTTTAGGTINTGLTVLTGGQLGSATTPGTFKANWANNSANVPLFTATPACGDGSTLPGTAQKANPCQILATAPNLRTPYVTNWTVDVQRAITDNLSLDVAYVGNHGTELWGLIDLNQPAFGSGWVGVLAGCESNPTAANCTPNAGPRPFAAKFPYLSNIFWLSNNNISNYNGLQVSATERPMHGLSFVVGYTFSHSLGESPDNWHFLVPVNDANMASLYGNTQFDITHRFTTSLTYAIPGKKVPGQLLEGWSINTILALQSALPWGVNDLTTDFSGTGEGPSNGLNSNNNFGETWDFFGKPSDFQTNRSMAGNNSGAGGIPYFAGTSNPACLAKASAMGPASVASLTLLGCFANGGSVLIPPGFGTSGTLAPNAFRGAPFYNWDLSITKDWKFKERLTTQFRAEFFNLLNHPNISNPYGGPGGDNTFTDPSTGAGFGFRPETPDVTSSNPVLGSGGPRAIQLGLKLIW